IPVNFCDEPWTYTDAEAQLAELLQKDCKEALEEAKRKHQTRLEAKQQRLEELNNSELTTLAEAMAEGTYLNEFRKNVFSRILLKEREILKQLAGFDDEDDWRDCFYLTPEEVRQLLTGEGLDLSAVKEQRSVAAYYTNEHGENVLLSPEEMEEL